MRTLLRITLWTAIIAALIIGALRAVAIRWWRLPTNDPWLEASIEPSLRGGDLIVLWRLTPPHFGDLVICPEPKAPERVVIGRILGEARDNIEIEGSNVTVNGHRLATERRCDERTVSVRHPGNHEPVERHAAWRPWVVVFINALKRAVTPRNRPASPPTCPKGGSFW
jgi:signal peptidase I